jgi:hypothetical protein
MFFKRMMLALVFCLVFMLSMQPAVFAADSQVIHQDGKPYRHPAPVTERMGTDFPVKLAGSIFRPYPGQFSVSLLLTGSPTCNLLRQVDPDTLRVGTISGGVNVTLTTGTTAFLGDGIYVFGTGILPGTTITYVDTEPNQFTLSQPATNNPGVTMTFWIAQSSFTTSQPGALITWPLGVPWRMLLNGPGRATVTWVQ